MRGIRTLFIACLFLIGCIALSLGAPPPDDAPAGEIKKQDVVATPEQNSVDKDIQVSQPFANELLALPGSLTTGAAVAIGAFALFYILSAAWPVFGLRTCNLLGTCGDYNNYAPAGTPYNNDAYSYSNPPPYTSTSYQKRSVSYVEPILRMLSSAYLQYGDTKTAGRQRRRR